MLNRRREKK